MVPGLILLALAVAAGRVTAQCPTLPSNPTLQTVAQLPDPFSWYPAGSGRVASAADWQCKQQHISTMMQQDELGTKPPAPTVSASFSGGSLSITASANGKSVQFSVSISLPSGNGPFPAIIAYDGASIPIPSSIAVITLNVDNIAAQQDSTSRGKGLFYNLYGTNASAGALMAWAWAVSVIMDALEMTPSTKIDPTRVGVTGCSRNGKGALVAGAFEPRIALTIPQESGSGGSACWRLSDAETGAPANVQTASEIINENVWFSTAFNQFSTKTTQLPFDHHMLDGLVAPRALFNIDNSGYQWLGPWSSWGCNLAGHTIYEALGVPDHFGFSMSSNHAHCSFPSEQQNDLNAFLNKFLLGQSTNTNIQSNYGQVSFPTSSWITWTNPNLSGGSTGTTTSRATTTTLSTSVSTVSTSTTTVRTTTTTTTTTAGGSGSPHWGQCGGIGWAGPTTCVSPYTCTVLNSYYSQCL